MLQRTFIIHMEFSVLVLLTTLHDAVGSPSYGIIKSIFGSALVCQKLRILVSASPSVTCLSHRRRFLHLPVGIRYSSTSKVAIHSVPVPYRARHDLSAAYWDDLSPGFALAGGLLLHTRWGQGILVTSRRENASVTAASVASLLPVASELSYR